MYFADCNPWNFISRPFLKNAPRRFTVFYCHSVAAVHRAYFARQTHTPTRLATPLRVDTYEKHNDGVGYPGMMSGHASEDPIQNTVSALEQRNIPDEKRAGGIL